jgi:hypothetical protein
MISNTSSPLAPVASARLLTLSSAARLELQWVHTADGLVGALGSLSLPPGEAALMARLRDIVLKDKAHPRKAARVAACWKRSASDDHDEAGR